MDVYRVEDKIKAIHCNRCQGIGQMREKVFQSATFFDGSPLQVRQAEIALFIWCRIPKWLQNQFVFQDVFDENIQRNLAERYMGKCVAAQQMPLILPAFQYVQTAIVLMSPGNILSDGEADGLYFVLAVMEETATREYTDRFGIPLSPAPLRAVAVNAAKALMELYPIKHASESRLKIENGQGGVIFNVIVPQPVSRDENDPA